MVTLNQASLAQLPADIRTPAYPRENVGIGIVHLGPGAFHRAHQAVYTDLALEHGGDWGICAVSMRSTGVRDQLREQDNLYTLAVIDEAAYFQVIGAIKEVLVLGEDRQQVMQQMTAATTHIISLTVTEKGYCLDNRGMLDRAHNDVLHDLANPQQPRSAVGLLVQALRLRYSAGLNNLTVISCDNLTDNGHKLKGAVVEFARILEPALADWIDVEVAFPNTMVDSITPATDDALVEQVSDALGVRDNWPIQREAFTQWVVEDNFSGPRPAWEKVGVTLTRDVSQFEKAKLRILNGSHSTLAYLGIRCGFESVYEAVSHPQLESLIRRMFVQQIIPSLTASEELDLNAYSEDILKRYHNRHIRHLLSQIAWDGSQKLPFRILGTVRDTLNQGKPTGLLTVSLAAWMLFIVEKSRADSPITDPLATELMAIGNACTDEPEADVKRFLALTSVFGELAENTGFCHELVAMYQTLLGLGPDNIDAVLGAL